MNVAPATSGHPRAARRTSCLGTFVLVLALWSLSVVVLAAYLVTRSAIVRQVRFRLVDGLPGRRRSPWC